MATNRFYKPSASEYQSVFVPERIPAELMMGVLANKQKTYDDTATKIQSLGDWNINALPGYDTEIRDQYKKNIRAFIDESMDKDLSSPEYARKYLAKLRDIKDDTNLAAITANYNHHQDYLKNIEALKKNPNTYAYAQELEYNYLRNFADYTKPTSAGGLGFKGDVKLADANILAGGDLQKEAEEVVNHIKEDGTERIKFLSEDLAYKEGWSTNEGKVDAAVASALDNWLNSRNGQQLVQRYRMNHGISENDVRNMNDEERKELLKKENTYAAQFLSDVAQGFKNSNYTTNADVAYRDRWGVGKEREMLIPQEPVINVAGNTSNIQKDYDTEFKANLNRRDILTNINWALNNYEKAKQNPNTPQLEQLAKLPPSKIRELEDQKYALELQTKDYEAKTANANKKAYTAINSGIDPKYVDEYGNFKIKLNPYEFSASGNNTKELFDIMNNMDREIKTILSTANDKYDIRNIASTNPALVYKTTQEIMSHYNKGIALINKMKATPNLTDAEKDNLYAYEQKFKINTAQIFSKVPEKYLQQSDGSYLHGLEHFEEAKKKHFNDSDTWVANNQLRSPDKVTVYNNTADKLGKPTTSADYMMEQYLSKSFVDNVVIEGNRTLQPGKDFDYPLSNGKAKIISSRVDKINGVDTPVFEVMAEYKEPGKVPHYDSEGNIDYYKDDIKTSTKQFTVIAKGVVAENYNNTKAKEDISIYMADPDSPTAKTALINGIKYKNPDLSSGLTELYSLSSGDKTVVDANTPGVGKLIWEVQKMTDFGNYKVKIIDPDNGQSIIKNYGTQHELSNDYLKYNGIDLNQILSK